MGVLIFVRFAHKNSGNKGAAKDRSGSEDAVSTYNGKEVRIFFAQHKINII